MTANRKVGYKKYSPLRIEYSKQVIHGQRLRYLTKQELAEWFEVVGKAYEKLTCHS